MGYGRISPGLQCLWLGSADTAWELIERFYSFGHLTPVLRKSGFCIGRLIKLDAIGKDKGFVLIAFVPHTPVVSLS